MTMRHLVRHDYGMGALWWWIRADSTADILAVLADVEVVDDVQMRQSVQSWELEEFDLADAVAGPLASFAERRARQRRDPAFGRLLGRNRVYLRMTDPSEDPGVWFTEHDPAGRRLRQVEVRPDGTAEATTDEDWPLNPPFDLGEPEYARMEISKDEFEQVWQRAVRSAERP